MKPYTPPKYPEWIRARIDKAKIRIIEILQSHEGICTPQTLGRFLTKTVKMKEFRDKAIYELSREGKIEVTNFWVVMRVTIEEEPQEINSDISDNSEELQEINSDILNNSEENDTDTEEISVGDMNFRTTTKKIKGKKYYYAQKWKGKKRITISLGRSYNRKAAEKKVRVYLRNHALLE